MTDDLTALRDLAEKATPGPWHFHQDDGTALDISEVCIPRPEEDVDLSIASLLEDRDGAFIAAANPATVLALLDRLERAERELEVAMAPHSDCVESGERAGAQMDDLKSRAERAEAAIERVRALHGFDGGYCKSCAIPFHECDIANALAAALDTGKETGSAESS